ncbi:hypothetical protein CP556_20430 [Natrinema sp. CBA1119]|nr:hypothetical protein CP556_20430 [Natrinema sp. CBA1119]
MWATVLSSRDDAEDPRFWVLYRDPQLPKIVRLLERDVAFRYLAANQHPDFRTISLFRKNHREEFEHLFVEILRLCRWHGQNGRSRPG